MHFRMFPALDNSRGKSPRQILRLPPSKSAPPRPPFPELAFRVRFVPRAALHRHFPEAQSASTSLDETMSSFVLRRDRDLPWPSRKSVPHPLPLELIPARSVSPSPLYKWHTPAR